MRIGERIASRLPRVIAERLRCSMATAGAESAPLAHPDGNPFLAARHEFMNAFGDLARGKRNWQLIAYALAGLLALVALADLRLAAAFLNDYFANPVNDPRLLGLRLTRQVDVTGVLRVPNSDVWRLQWTETERSTQPGGLTRTVAWEGYVTVRLVPPRTVDAVQDNPLGLAVTSVNWTQVGASASAGPVAGADTTLDQGVKP